MKLVERKHDPKKGFRLTYESNLSNRTYEDTLNEWLKRELQWKKKREESKREN